MVSAGVVLVSLITLALGSPTARPMRVHESRVAAPQGYVLSGPAPPDTVLGMRLALAQSDIPGLHKALYDVSTPGSPLYGQYMTKEEVEKLVAPKPESISAVDQWLKEHGITASTISPAGDWLGFSVPVSKANELLDTKFFTYTHEATGEKSIRTLAYSIPTDLKDHIDLVSPTISFFSPLTSVKTLVSPSLSELPTPEVVPASCTRPLKPQCILDLYSVPSGTVAKSSSNVLAVTGYNGLNANQADLKSFITQFRPDLSPDTTFGLQTLNGGSNSQNSSQAGTEPDMDTQYTVGIASGVPVVFLSVGPPARGHEAFADTANFLLSEQNPPTVVTTSYDYSSETEFSSAEASNLCNAYAQLGLRGTSVLFSSGDHGVGAGNCTTFVPSIPSDCPFVTSVGATSGTGPEVAAGFSTGGFSNYFSTPSYQQAAVSGYLATLGNTNAGLFNRSGRGFPDVSAQGDDLRIIVGGAPKAVDGTSCSSPIFASIVALLNDALASAGRPPLGFLNPFLYSDAGKAALTDITSGSNPGCGTNGFPAAAGWDPVTGLGTPNYAKLKAALGL